MFRSGSKYYIWNPIEGGVWEFMEMRRESRVRRTGAEVEPGLEPARAKSVWAHVGQEVGRRQDSGGVTLATHYTRVPYSFSTGLNSLTTP
jgi:hypothetical protein